MERAFYEWCVGIVLSLCVVAGVSVIAWIFNYYYGLSRKNFSAAVLCTVLTCGLPVAIGRHLLGI